VPATLRFDPDPPQLASSRTAATDPTKVSIEATDALSGVAGGSIEIAREGTGMWQALVTDLEGDRLVARIDDTLLSPARTCCGRGPPIARATRLRPIDGSTASR
jgi:hypothetical protein